MIVSIHQPHFLPWLGYMNKLLQSDVFVWLDSVQYRKNYFQNRTEIRRSSGDRAWLTLPVHAPFGSLIRDVSIADAQWRDRVASRIEQEYRAAAHFEACWPPIRAAMVAAPDRLSEVNLGVLRAVLALMGASRPRIVRMEELAIEDGADPTTRLVQACRALGATSYIAGRGGRNYLRTEDFTAAGIEILWQDFKAEEAVYPQPGPAFVPGLSVIDCMFRIGAAAACALATSAWVAKPSVVR